MQTKEMIATIQNGGLDEKILDIYVDATKLTYQKERYVRAIRTFESNYGAGDAQIFSAPGRSEVEAIIRTISMEKFWLHP